MMNNSGQTDLFNPTIITQPTIVIVGCGAINSAVTEALCRMGFNNFVLIDFDSVEDHNRSNKLFNYFDVGKKVEALKRKIIDIDPEVSIKIIDMIITENSLLPQGDLLIVGFDNMKSRKIVYEKSKDYSYLIDGRMGGLSYSIYSCDLKNKESREYYEKTLYDDTEAKQERCSAKGIIFNTFGVASDMCNLVRKIYSKKSYPKEINKNFDNDFYHITS